MRVAPVERDAVHSAVLIPGMDTQIVYAAMPGPQVCLQGGNVVVTGHRGSGYLPVVRVAATLDEVRSEAARVAVPTTVLAVQCEFPAGSRFEVLQGSESDRHGRASVAVFSDFLQALRVAQGRGHMGVGHCRIDMTEGPRVYDTAEEFWSASRTRRTVPLLCWQGLNAEFFVVAPSAPAPGSTSADETDSLVPSSFTV